MAKPPPSVSSCVISTVRLEPTAQYRPRIRPMRIRIGVSPSVGKQNRISQKAVEACCICTCPVVNTARIFVHFFKRTSSKFMINAINSSSMTCEKVLPKRSPSPAVTAFCPKYGSMTIASRLKRSFNPTRIGRKLLTSPPDPTARIIYPTVALIKPANASYNGFLSSRYPTRTMSPMKYAGCVRIFVAKKLQILIRLFTQMDGQPREVHVYQPG